MSAHEHESGQTFEPHCCPCCRTDESEGITRRGFLGGMGGAAFGGMALTYLSISELMAADAALPAAPPRKPLVVKPVLCYDTPTRRTQSSWRNWGGIQTQQDADAEAARIRGELDKLRSAADFPIKVLPLSIGRTAAELASAKEEIATADVVVLYAAGGWAFDFVAKTAKDVIFFCRHKSGPVYLWYEIVSPRYLRQHTDALKVQGHDDRDVVIDSQEELLWRFRSLCGLKNTLGSRVIAIGGPGGWATPSAPKLAKDIWKLDIQTVSYKELGELIKAARADQSAVKLRTPPGRRVSQSPRHQSGDRSQVRRERLLVGGHLPRPDAEGRVPRPDDQRLHGHDHAPGRDHGLPADQHAQRRRLSDLLRVGLRGDSGGDLAVERCRPAVLHERPHLSPRRCDHLGPLHRRAEDGRQEPRTGPDPHPFRVGL